MAFPGACRIGIRSGCCVTLTSHDETVVHGVRTVKL
jgi:hypothetical protein